MTNLLVVDNEQSVSEALGMILSDFGYQVQAITSGEAALDILHTLKQGRPDLIITDIIMPEMTGLQLFEVVRASANLDSIPFLFISAFITPEIEALITSQDKTAFLRKPFEVEELVKTVASMCGL